MVRITEHEHKEHRTVSPKKSKSDFHTWGLAIVIVLLVILSYQISYANKSLDSMEAKLDGLVTAPSIAGNAAVPTAPTAAAPGTVNMDALLDDDAVEGSPDAKVTIVEWSDFECPYCGRFYSQTYGQLKSEYIDTGKVKFVFRDFPLPFHSNAQKAAEAAECAGEQGKYYEMHNKLFESGVSGGVTAFKKYASDIGLDTAKFNTCLDSGQMAAETAKDMKDGQANGITGTPGFLINGQKISGAQPFANFKAVIDAELAK